MDDLECAHCGHIMDEEDELERCPKCGAPSDSFLPYDDSSPDPDPEPEPDDPEPEDDDDPYVPPYGPGL